MAATREARGGDGAGAGLEADVLVLLPVPAGHGALHAGALGADCVQYPARAAVPVGARRAGGGILSGSGPGRRKGGGSRPATARRPSARQARLRCRGRAGGVPAVGSGPGRAGTLEVSGRGWVSRPEIEASLLLEEAPWETSTGCALACSSAAPAVGSVSLFLREAGTG